MVTMWITDCMVRHPLCELFTLLLFSICIKNNAYPEIGNANFKCALWTFV